ncbi:MAG: GIY-YIG nuclease family protein [Lutibacter sp.]|nr:GIY-YIG nuclease family protein [Lutibacter sp.]
MNNFTTYIIYSKTLDKYYIGFTADIVSRLQRHNQKGKGFTGKENDWQLVYKEEFASKAEAYLREREIKKWKSRKKIIELIGSGHPD